jgi:hypothetical protein
MGDGWSLSDIQYPSAPAKAHPCAFTPFLNIFSEICTYFCGICNLRKKQLSFIQNLKTKRRIVEVLPVHDNNEIKVKCKTWCHPFRTYTGISSN